MATLDRNVAFLDICSSNNINRDALIETLQHTDKYRTAMLDNAAIQANAICVVKQTQLQHTVHAAISASEFKSLCNSFSSLSLVHVPTDHDAHAFARAHRRLSYFHMLQSFNLKNTSKIWVKDVGGNPIFHYNHSHLHVHTCQPVLSLADAIRASKSDNHFRTVTPNNLQQRQFIRNLNSHLCRNISQNCYVQCPYIIFLHSIYDIDIASLGKIMFNSGAIEARGCFIFTPDILVSNSNTGYIQSHQCHYRIHMVNDVRTITFSFRQDTQLSYSHNFYQYISLIKPFVITYRDDTYIYNVDSIKNDVLFFSIIKSTVHIPPCNVIRTLPFNIPDDHVVVYYWSLLHIPNYDTFLSLFKSNHLQRCRLVVPRRLIESLTAYAMQLPSTQRTIEKLMTAAVSFSRREIYNAVSVVSPYDIQIDDLAQLVYAIYLRIYSLNFDLSQTFAAVKNNIDIVRSINSSSYFIRRFRKFFFTTPSPDLVNDFSKLDVNSSTIQFTHSQSVSIVNSIVKRFNDHIHSTYIHDIFTPVLNSLTFVSIEEELLALSQRSSPTDFSDFQVSISSDVLSTYFSGSKTITPPPDYSIPDVNYICVGVEYSTSNPIFDFSSFFCVNPSYSHLKLSFLQQLSVIDEYSRQYNECVIIVTDKRTYAFGYTSPITKCLKRTYLYYSNNIYYHCTATLDWFKPFQLPPSITTYYKRVFDDCLSIHTVHSSFFPFHSRKHFNTFAGSVNKTIEIIHHFSIPVTRPLCIGAPGSSAFYFVTNNIPVVHGISLIGTDVDWNVSLYSSPSFIDINDKNGDITKITADDIAKYGKFDYIDGDASSSDTSDFVTATLDIAINSLVDGGTVAIKVQHPDILRKKDLSKYTMRFKSVKIFKPHYLSRSTEFFLVFISFNYSHPVPFSYNLYNNANSLIASHVCGAVKYAYDLAHTGVTAPVFVYSTAFDIFINSSSYMMTSVKRSPIAEAKSFVSSVLSYISPPAPPPVKPRNLAPFIPTPIKSLPIPVPVPDSEITPNTTSSVSTVPTNVPVPTPVDSTDSTLPVIQYAQSHTTLPHSPFHAVYTTGDGNCGWYALYSSNKLNVLQTYEGIKEFFAPPNSAPPSTILNWRPGQHLTDIDLAYISSTLKRNLHIHVLIVVGGTVNTSASQVQNYINDPTYPYLCVSHSLNHWSITTCRCPLTFSPILSGGCTNALSEYVDYCRNTVEAILSNTINVEEKVIFSKPNFSSLVKANARFNSSYLVDSNHNVYPGDVPFDISEYKYFICNGILYNTRCIDQFFKENDCYQIAGNKYVLFNDFCIGAIEYQIITIYSDMSFTLPVVVNFCQAGAGCGKTYAITHHPSVNRSLIVTSSNKTVSDIQRKLEVLGVVADVIHFVKASTTKLRTYRDVFVDEAFMQHPGLVCAIASATKCHCLNIYGDGVQAAYHPVNAAYQLEYLNYNDTFVANLSLLTSYRVPADIAAYMDPIYHEYCVKYNFPVCSYKTYNTLDCTTRRSVKLVTIRSISDLPQLTNVYVFTEVDKQLIPGALTIAQIQGSESRHVNIVRLNTNVNHFTYLDQGLVTTALTRHTVSMTYYTTVSTDLLSCAIISITALSVAAIRDHQLSRTPTLTGGYTPTSVDITPSYVADIDTFSHTSVTAPVVTTLSCLPSNVTNALIVSPRLFQMHNASFIYQYLRDRYPGVRLHTTSSINDTYSHDVFTHMVRNALFNNVTESRIIYTPLPVTPLSQQVDICPLDVNMLQFFVSSIVGCRTFDCTDYDDFFVSQFSDLFLAVDNTFTRTVTKGLYKQRTQVCLIPKLRLPVPNRRPNTFRELIIASNKRNFSVPKLADFVDFEQRAQYMLDCFVTKCVKPGYIVQPIQPSAAALAEWFQIQGTVTTDIVMNSDPFWNTAGDRYSFAIKTSPKRVFPNFLYSYQALQTISAHDKVINSIASPLFMMYRDNIISALRDNIVIFTKLSNADLASLIPYRTLFMQKREFDISMYDKSQGYLALLFEFKLMHFFGFSLDFCHFWFSCRLYSKYTSPGTGLSFDIWCQMKSGAANTFISNTLHQIAVIFAEWNPSPEFFAIFCGDDSVLWDYNFDANDLQLSRFAYIYNFEMKRLIFDSTYFAGKFILYTPTSIVLVPDPIKLLMALCRRDIPNPAMLVEIQSSFTDLYATPIPFCCVYALSAGLIERYKLCFSPILLIHSIPSIVQNMSSLFDIPPGIDYSTRYKLS